jgi:hypothetical protein
MRDFYKNNLMQIQVTKDKKHILLQFFNQNGNGSALKIEDYNPTRWKELAKIIGEQQYLDQCNGLSICSPIGVPKS